MDSDVTIAICSRAESVCGQKVALLAYRVLLVLESN